MFNFNDSLEETDLAQKIAEEVNVDGLLFVITNSPERSEIYTPETLHRLPIKSPKTVVAPAAALQRKTRQARIELLSGKSGDLSGGIIMLDRAHWTNGGLLEVEGWAVDQLLRPATPLICTIGDGLFHKAGRPLLRRDVVEVFPKISDPVCGFKFRLPTQSPDAVHLTISQDTVSASENTLSVLARLTPI